MTALLDPTIRPTYDADEPPSWDATVLNADTGPVQWRSRRAAPRHLVSLAYDFSIDEPGAPADDLDDFFRGVCNPFVPFYLYSTSPWHRWLNVAAGAGTGSAVDFPIPLCEIDAASEVVTVAGSAKVRGLDYELGPENRCIYSEDFSQAATWLVYSASSVTRTSGQTDPLGGSKAWRLQTSGGGATMKCYQPVGVLAAGRRALIDTWIKVQGTYAVTVGSNIAGQPTQTVAVGAGWTHVQLVVTGDGATSQAIAFFAPAAGNALDFFVWHPLMVWEVTTVANGRPAPGLPYIPTGAAALTWDTATWKWRIEFYPGRAPALSAAIVISCRGRRLLLGMLTAEPDGPHITDYREVSYAVSVSGEEA